MADIGFGPLWRIDGPLPVPQQHGLLAAAEQPAAGVEIITDTDGVNPLTGEGVERWMNGVEVYPYPPNTGDVWRACDTGTDVELKDFGAEVAHPQFEPMTLYLAETCTSFKVWDQDEFKARAVAALTATESFLMAREFMTGAKLSSQPYLSDGESLFPNDDVATSPVHGLTLLEEAIANSGRQGVIHASPMMATTLMGNGFALKDKTGVIRTINGIVVVADFGYAPGSKVAPVGHAAASGTENWAYATGPLEIRRTKIITLPDNVEEAMERGVAGASTGHPNSITYRVERYALVDWDTEVHAAVLVDNCMTACASA